MIYGGKEKMDLTELERKKRTRRISVSVKVPVTASVFMKEKNLSPTKIFMTKLEEIGWKE